MEYLEVEVVINEAYGGFALSSKAEKLICERKDVSFKEDWKYYNFVSNLPRWDKDLVDVVRELGKEAQSSKANNLVIKKVYISIDVKSYDGWESIEVNKGY